MLKTAGGYLLVLHTFEEMETSSESCVRLLQKAKEVGDWDLCKELARFLMALDESGDTLRAALERMDLNPTTTAEENDSVRLKTPRPNTATKRSSMTQGQINGSQSPAGNGENSSVGLGLGLGLGLGFETKQHGGSEDYFSQRRA